MTQDERDRLVRLEEKFDGMDKKLDKIIDDHEKRIRCLESKPGKRWNTAVAVIIAAILTTGINFAIQAILK